jgi:zinc protease
MRLLLLTMAVAACGPKAKPIPIPMLPGEGDANVAKPSASTPGEADPWVGRGDLIPPPPALPPTPVELPAIDNYKLGNGLQVFVIKSDRLPVASVQLAVRAGRMHEPQSRLGVAEMTADMLVKGTQRRDAKAIAKAVDFVGGTIAADSTYEATLLSCSVLARDLGTCLELVPELATQPSFPGDELARTRERGLAGVRQRLDDPAGLAAAHVQNLLWSPEHVRGWVTAPESIGALTRDDLIAWHKTWFVPGNAMLVVTGDVNGPRLKADLERTFGRWQRGPVPPTPSYKEPGLSGSRIRLVDRPGLTQTQIRVAQFGIAHDDARFFDSLVWNHALGGGGNARLGRALRGGGRLFGNAASAFDRNLDRGSFVASAVVRNADAVAATKLVLAEIARMAKDGPTDDEIVMAIAALTGSYGLRYQSAADVGAALIGAELHKFGKEYLQNYPVAVGRVDAASAKRAAGEVLTPNGYVLVLVGDAKDLEPQLKAAGWRYQKVAFNEPVFTPAAKPEGPVDPKVAAAAKALVEEALAAKGGKAKLAAVKGLKVVASGTTTIQKQAVPIEIERLLVLPDRMRIDATLAQRVKVVVAVSGKTGWQIAPDASGAKLQLVDIKPEEIVTIDFERWREPELILLRALDPKTRLVTGADDTINGAPQSVVRLRSPFDVDVTLYLDKKTKLLTRLSFNEGGTTQVQDFSDYKVVNGIKIAHKHQSSGGGRLTTLELKTVELDPKWEAKVFEKPAAIPEK